MTRLHTEKRCAICGKPGTLKEHIGWTEMADALVLIRRGLGNGSITSKPLIQFPPPGSKKRNAEFTSVEKIVKKALRKAGVK